LKKTARQDPKKVGFRKYRQATILLVLHELKISFIVNYDILYKESLPQRQIMTFYIKSRRCK